MGCNVMTYDFTTIMDRSGKDALAVDAIGAYVSWAVVPTKPKDGFSAIPMWVADMNFPTVPTIPREIIKRAEHPAYGYYIPTKEYYDSIIGWHEKRNGVTGLNADNIFRRSQHPAKRLCCTVPPILALRMYWRIQAELPS